MDLKKYEVLFFEANWWFLANLKLCLQVSRNKKDEALMDTPIATKQKALFYFFHFIFTKYTFYGIHSGIQSKISS
jgi:hypothetical protein